MTLSLNSIFSSVIFKELVQVDIPGGSNQHEINGVEALKIFFSTSTKISGTIHWHYFSDNHEPISDSGEFSFYDARERSVTRTGRSEWRMYYQGNFLKYAAQGDVLVLARSNENVIYGLIFQAGSAWWRAAQILFKFSEANSTFQIIDDRNLLDLDLEFVKQQILEELGIEISLPVLPSAEEIARRELERSRNLQKDFPSTRRMSELARSLVEVDNSLNGDSLLLYWLGKEEEVFRAIEKIIIQEKLERGFNSVDDFISYSLSVQNRRKSRMGFALQNHLEQLFKLRGLKFETQKNTEGKNKPDFLFPGQQEYLDPFYNPELLIMLGVKSTCKDRWRQILTEAKRISQKHLCTLEEAISVGQTNEMHTQNVILVLPELFHPSYLPIQLEKIWSVEQFITHVHRQQSTQ